MSRVVWTVIVLAFAAMAVTGPLKMIRLSRDESDTGSASEAPAAGGDKRVGMAGLAFGPSELAVARGTEVLFDNDDAAPHTVTAADGSIDSGILNPGKSFRLVINEPFDCKCLIHPSMTARVVMSG